MLLQRSKRPMVFSNADLREFLRTRDITFVVGIKVTTLKRLKQIL